RFTTTVLLQAFPQVKYIIDLTNTDRYYDEKEFTNFGVKYEKIMIPGREVPSTESVIRLHFSFVSDDIIGVHCTHGVNRSGYLICRYLVQQLGWEPEFCLKAFEEARGYSIERKIYLNALQKTPREKIDTSKISMESSSSSSYESLSKRKLFSHPASGGRFGLYTMGPPGLVSARRGFAKDGPFSPGHFGFGGPPPGFRPMPPPPGMPPVPPLPGPPPMYGPRPFRYGPPPAPSMRPPPPRPGFPFLGFPPPRPPPTMLPPPKMPPPPPPRVTLQQLQTQKKKSHIRHGVVSKNRAGAMRQNSQLRRILPKLLKEQDFTVDTFEENLLAVSTQTNRRPNKGRYNQRK
ncbi:putative tyrosine-protein phosphatase F54C8.4, partial [Eufriesea mexicana]